MSEQMNDEYLVCYKHPDRRTLLRCNKCGRPICPECAVQTPTGYRCKECIKAQQKVFDTSENKDYFIGGAIAAFLGIIGSYAEQIIPFSSILVALIAGYIFGHLTCLLVRKAVNRRRSRTLNIVITASAAAGVLLVRHSLMSFFLSEIFAGGVILLNGLINLLLSSLYMIVLCVTIWMEMKGMVFRR